MAPFTHFIAPRARYRERAMNAVEAHARRRAGDAARVFREVCNGLPLDDAPHERVHLAHERAAEALSAVLHADEGRLDDLVVRICRARARVVGAALAIDAHLPEGGAARASQLVGAARALLEAEAVLRGGEAALPPLPLDELSLGRCAGLEASIDFDPPSRAAILSDAGVDDDTFERLRTHWHGEIERDGRRGKKDRLTEYDHAYVARLEELRGPVTVEETADLKVASGRGTQAELLARLRIPPRAVMRIERVWLTRLCDNVELRKRMRAALEERREA